MGKFFTPDDVDPEVQEFIKNLMDTPLNIIMKESAKHEIFTLRDVVTINYNDRESLAQGLKMLKRDTALARKRAECGAYVIQEIEKFFFAGRDKPELVIIENRRELEKLITEIVDDRIVMIHRLRTKPWREYK
jgi:hypothetical protein